MPTRKGRNWLRWRSMCSRILNIPKKKSKHGKIKIHCLRSATTTRGYGGKLSPNDELSEVTKHSFLLRTRIDFRRIVEFNELADNLEAHYAGAVIEPFSVYSRFANKHCAKRSLRSDRREIIKMRRGEIFIYLNLFQDALFRIHSRPSHIRWRRTICGMSRLREISRAMLLGKRILFMKYL